jgi:hypothetical protein
MSEWANLNLKKSKGQVRISTVKFGTPKRPKQLALALKKDLKQKEIGTIVKLIINLKNGRIFELKTNSIFEASPGLEAMELDGEIFEISNEVMETLSSTELLSIILLDKGQNTFELVSKDRTFFKKQWDCLNGKLN